MSKNSSRLQLSRWPLLLVLMIVASATAGCALPGYNAGSVENNWYDFSYNGDRAVYSDALEESIDFEPRVLQISPQLIRFQQAAARDRSLPASLERISVASASAVNYVIGAGDILQVIVFGHPELTNPGGSTGGNNDGIQGQLVGADGSFYYPYVGQIQAAGLTLAELRQKIAQGLSRYIRQPQVDVRVREYRSQRVYISGDIQQPCTVPITDIALTVIQALSQCETLASAEGGGAGIQNLSLIRGGETTEINVSQLYSTGQAVPLEPGDRLLIDDSANRVFLIGEFSQQMALPFSTDGMYLSDAIADVGGVSLSSADTSSIYVIRGFVENAPELGDNTLRTVVRPNVYELDMSNPAGMLLANQFELEPRDIIFAAPANFVNFNRALSLVLPSLSAITQSYLVYDTLSDRNRN